MSRIISALGKPLLTLFALLLAVIAYLDARITGTFEDRRFELPARVYARSLEIYPGATLTLGDLRRELDQLAYRAVSAVRRPGEYRVAGNTMELFRRSFDFPDGHVDARRVSLRFAADQLAELRSGSARVDLLRLDPLSIGGIYPAHGEDRLLVPLDAVPPRLVAALLAIEDRGFYQHWGFSLSGIARAALSNLRSGSVVAGGSTITQQLVKNYYLSPERSIRRKLIELVMAVLLELHVEKAQILEGYINEIYLGQEGARAIHGFALAAMHYFDTPLEDLGLHQEALLVGMIRGPSLYNPRRNPQRARERRDLVLSVMEEQGIINSGQATVARAMPLDLGVGRRRQDSWPAYLDLVRRHLREQYRREDYASVGLRIFTAFDPMLQRQLEASSAAVMDRLDRDGALQTASVVTRAAGGEVVAVLGGRRPRVAGFNRALDARRPAGSLLKPAVYLAALERSDTYTLATPLDDSAVQVAGRDGSLWAPRNFDRESHGQVPLHRALAKSYNQASARLGMAVGIPAVVDMLRRLGLRQPVPEVPSLVLGAGEYSPLMMARLYQTIAVDGTRTPLRSILAIQNRHGELLRANYTEFERVVDRRAVHLLHYALREVLREGTGRGAYRVLPSSMHAAGKTGTTNDGRDAWFAGFSGDLLTITWIGSDDNTATGLTGSGAALPLWAHFMAAAAKRPLAYRMPDGVELHWVEDGSGRLSMEGCEGARVLPFIGGTQPRIRSDCARPGNPVRNWFERLFRDRS